MGDNMRLLIGVCFMVILAGMGNRSFAQANAQPAGVADCWGLTEYDSSPQLPPRFPPMPELKAGEVVGADPSFFFGEVGPNCALNPIECRYPNQPYLVSGDPVVITGSAPGYWCVEYAKRTQPRYAGWMPKDRIRLLPLPVPSVPLSSWVGTWRDGSTTIILSRRNHGLLAYGDATAPGGIYSGPHLGSINAIGVPSGNSLSLGANELGKCYVELLRIRELLVAVDNGGCGGMNVTFAGIYVRK
jgi:hypothetical protein